MACTWRDNPDLMSRLTEAQNSPAFEHQDILTWAAMCDTRAELERHVLNCETRAANYVPVRRPRRSRKVVIVAFDASFREW
jgi:hypothetical protein